MTLHALRARLADPAPAFECVALDESVSRVRLQHHLGTPAREKHLAGLARFLDGAAPSLVALYREVDGMRLYADGGFDTVLVELAPINAMPDLQDAFLDAIALVDEPGALETALVFGEAPGSGEPFLVATEGPTRGQILRYDHEEQRGVPFARDADELCARLADPMRVVREIAPFLGFGPLAAKPVRYLPDIDALEKPGPKTKASAHRRRR